MVIGYGDFCLTPLTLIYQGIEHEFLDNFV
jgi:hypothetical protein